jgi:hypothetical protein
MESSRFIQIAEDILIEYVYTDQSNPTVFSTGAIPIEILKNQYNSGTYFYNIPSVYSNIGASRENSAITVNASGTEYVSLNTDVGVPYNDYDPKLTPTADLLQEFSPDINIQYDRVRVHFVSGFSFNNYDGIVFDIKTVDRNGGSIILSSVNFLKTDSPIFNPSPLLIADRLYSTYIEWRLPALYYLSSGFNLSNQNSLSYKLTDGKGFRTSPVLNISAFGILKTTIANGYSFYQMKEINSTAIPSRDIYDSLYASVKESDEGDYFELQGMVVGSTLSAFINQLNTAGGNYVVFHEITLIEQIGSSFIETSNQIMTQTENFDAPILYRPIVLNTANAVSFAINYTIRLYNRVDNTQIIKNARLSLFDPNKYGKRIMKINLGTVPTVANIVNQVTSDDSAKIVISTGSSTNRDDKLSDDIVSQLAVKTRYVTSFRDKVNVKAAISPVKIQNITGK